MFAFFVVYLNYCYISAMKFLVLIGFLFTLSVSFSASVIHSDVTEKQMCFDVSDSVSDFDYTIVNESVDFNYSSVATLPTFEVNFSSSLFVGISYASLSGCDSIVFYRNKGDPINI